MRVENNRGTANEGTIGGYWIDKDTSQKESKAAAEKAVHNAVKKNKNQSIVIYNWVWKSIKCFRLRTNTTTYFHKKNSWNGNVNMFALMDHIPE